MLCKGVCTKKSQTLKLGLETWNLFIPNLHMCSQMHITICGIRIGVRVSPTLWMISLEPWYLCRVGNHNFAETWQAFHSEPQICQPSLFNWYWCIKSMGIINHFFWGVGLMMLLLLLDFIVCLCCLNSKLWVCLESLSVDNVLVIFKLKSTH